MTDKPLLEIWTDGACKFNPGPGGWGVLMVYGSKRKELWGGDKNTTNNQMELTAVIQAFRAIRRPCPVRFHLDSSYVKDGITSWIKSWKARGWKLAGNRPVKNAELWKTLDELVTRYETQSTIEWVWVKGHAGNPGNEKADELANRGVAELGVI